MRGKRLQGKRKLKAAHVPWGPNCTSYRMTARRLLWWSRPKAERERTEGAVAVTEKSGLICSLEMGPRHRHKKERVTDKAQEEDTEIGLISFLHTGGLRGDDGPIPLPHSPGRGWLPSWGHPIKAGPLRCSSLGMWTGGPVRLGWAVQLAIQEVLDKGFEDLLWDVTEKETLGGEHSIKWFAPLTFIAAVRRIGRPRFLLHVGIKGDFRVRVVIPEGPTDFLHTPVLCVLLTQDGALDFLHCRYNHICNIEVGIFLQEKKKVSVKILTSRVDCFSLRAD